MTRLQRKPSVSYACPMCDRDIKGPQGITPHLRGKHRLPLSDARRIFVALTTGIQTDVSSPPEPVPEIIGALLIPSDNNHHDGAAFVQRGIDHIKAELESVRLRLANMRELEAMADLLMKQLDILERANSELARTQDAS